MKNYWLVIIIIFFCSLFTAALYFSHTYLNSNVFKFNYKVGQIADRDIIAPFSFPVLKSQDMIDKEKEQIADKFEPIYFISDEQRFNSFKKMNDFFENLAMYGLQSDIAVMKEILRERGFELSDNTLSALRENKTKASIFNYLMRKLNSAFDNGVIRNDFSQNTIRLRTNNSINRNNTDRFYRVKEISEAIINEYPDQDSIFMIRELLPYFITDNIVVDSEATERALRNEYSEINTIITEVLENEEIVRKNRRISELDLKKIDALSQEFKKRAEGADLYDLIVASAGYFLLSFFLFLGGYFLLSILLKDKFTGKTHYVIYLSLLVFSAVCAFVVAQIEYLPPIAIPYALSVLLFTLYYKQLAGIVFNSINLILILPFFNWSLVGLDIQYLTIMLLILIMIKMKDNPDWLPLTFYLLLSFFAISTIITMNKGLDLTGYITTLSFGSIASVVAIAGVVILKTPIEKKLHFLSDMILLSLLDTNTPLLKRIAEEIPGTHLHSQTVGLLAESAAKAIGANSLLARVGGYYHDVGKLVNSEIFIENNSNSPKIHEKMEYYESATAIKEHVSEGVIIARKYKLPEPVIDIIREHHGNSRVGYFYKRALEENENVDENQFRYLNPRPKSKEAALVMIADIVESTAKAKLKNEEKPSQLPTTGQLYPVAVKENGHTEESLAKIIDDTIEHLIQEKQLFESPLTFRDLEVIKNYMLPILLGIYGKRIDY